jgi:hypothetical protein
MDAAWIILVVVSLMSVVGAATAEELLAAARINPASALCQGGYWTDCFYNLPSCKGGFYRSGQTCRWGSGDCPSLCFLGWVSSGRDSAGRGATTSD